MDCCTILIVGGQIDAKSAGLLHASQTAGTKLARTVMAIFRRNLR